MGYCLTTAQDTISPFKTAKAPHKAELWFLLFILYHCHSKRRDLELTLCTVGTNRKLIFFKVRVREQSLSDIQFFIDQFVSDRIGYLLALFAGRIDRSHGDDTVFFGHCHGVADITERCVAMYLHQRKHLTEHSQ